MTLEVGVGLWTFQSTAHHPRSTGRAYRDFPSVARRVEELGFAHLWLGEHRFWYDGWCPAPLMPIAAAAAATTSLRLGTAMALLPQHDPERLRQQVESVRAIAGDRLELGVGLGHRDAEFDGVGLARNRRGRRMEAGLDVLRREPAVLPATRIWVGGMAPAALQRLGRRGLSSLMPQTLSSDATRRAVSTISEAAHETGAKPGRIGMLKDVWVDVDGDRAREWFLPRLRQHYLEEAGAWWVLKGDTHGFARPEDLRDQVDRVVASAVVGTPAEVAERLDALAEDGVESVVARLNFDFVDPSGLDEVMELFASTVLKAVAP